ncbi:Geranylgeranyl transferase type-2 subunit beta [Candida maltosa Xu316]|uniref:Geranylgeranyl transferase type-2 subunit beta n=1 Tax=Candida maltosa (strain Xu316) TaxID=1245528 RepID=M3JAT6_CANMX|nr:Geranylgeranyl transferase type-2 subunit beta [Candida maltosa Xu316]
MAPPPFVKSKHVQYIINQEQNRTFEYWLSEHLRMNGLYWGVTALITMNELSALPSSEVIKYVLSCWDENSGAFGSFPKHDGHILSTLSALQILKIYSPELSMLTDVQKQKLKDFIIGLQLPDGSFQGDRYGEVDTRFVYTAVSALSLLGELSDEIGDRASRFIMRCFNFDGGFGLVPGSESHAAQVFTCVGTLAIVGKLGLLTDEKRIKMVDWLTERQVLPSGGFNGRAEKLPDVCYSWWVLSSLKMVDSADLIDKERLEEFILECQDLEHGGFGDRPDNATDVYHTCFSITALSLLDYEKYGFIEIDPIYCMPLKK